MRKRLLKLCVLAAVACSAWLGGWWWARKTAVLPDGLWLRLDVTNGYYRFAEIRNTSKAGMTNFNIFVGKK